MTELTLALPAYNEADNIGAVLADCKAALDELGWPWEILVIDNESTDNTADTAEAFAREHGSVRVIRHPENRLYSGSCETALRNARGRFVAIMDSDGQATPRDLPIFIDMLERGHNLVFGWRRKRHDPLTRLLMSRVFNAMGRWYLRYPFHDLNCGYRVFDRTFIDAAVIRHRVNLVNPELYVRARLANLSIGEVAVDHRPRAGGHTSHDFRKLVGVFVDVRRYFVSLRAELRAAGRSDPPTGTA